MSEGATTTGSIDAKLTIDKSAWDRKKDEAKAEAAELGALSPEIKVKADVGPALAKLAAVAKAERDLESSYMRASIAQTKLDQVTKKYGEDSIQAASARLTLKRALDAETDSEVRLTAARGRSTVVQNEETKATDRRAESVRRSTEANRRHISGIGVLIATSPAIVAAAAPIAASAVGLGAAFGVMSVAGVAAVFGIKKEMETGTAVGNQYAAGLGALKGDMQSLAKTSAVAMLGAFNQTVGDVNRSMPFLNQLVGESSGLLGNMGGTALRSVIAGLDQANPLIQQGGVELGKFVSWLFSFVGSDGFSRFIAYAQQNLPGVMHLIESLVTLAGNILSAFAPLGPAVIGILTGISDALSGLPLPVLAGLVTSAVTLAPALRIASAAMGLFAIESQLAVPVVGILTAAIAGIVTGVATSNAALQQGTASLTSYGDAVERDNGLIGENVRLQAAHAATTTEMRDAADQLGISTETVMKAMLGNKDATDQVNKALDTSLDFLEQHTRKDEDLVDASYRIKDAQDLVSAGVKNNSTMIQQNLDTYKALHEITDKATQATDADTLAKQLNASTYGTSVGTYDAAREAQDKAKTSTQEQTVAMQLQNDAAGLLKMTLDGLNGEALNAAQAQNAFDSSLANMGDHVDKSGNQIKFTTTSIGDMSAASVALRGQLNGQISALQNVVEANGGLDDSTGKARKQMQDMRQQIIDNAVAHGVDKDAVTAYIDKLLKIPAKVPPTKVDIDKAEAELKLRGFQSAIDALTGKTVHIYSVEHIQQVRESGNTGLANSMNAANQYATGSAYRKATGGAVIGPGSGTSDDIPAWLSNGEHVLTAKDVQKMGGQDAVYRFRALLDAGQAPKFAAGGAVAGHLGESANARANRLYREAQKRHAELQKSAQYRSDQLATLNLDYGRGQSYRTVDDSLASAYSFSDRLRSVASSGNLPSMAGALRGRADSSDSRLRVLFGQSERLGKSLDAAKQKMQDLAQVRDNVGKSLADGFSIGKAALFGGSAAEARSSASGYLATVQAFAGKLKKLQQMGFTGAIIQEIAGLGAVDGSTAADSLLTASASEVRGLNSTMTAIGSASNQAGSYVANSLGLGAVASSAKRIESQQGAIDKAILQIGLGMENALRTALGGKAIHRATGGIIPQYRAAGGEILAMRPHGKDTTPVMAEPGEFMIKRASAASIGAPTLNYMNETGKVPTPARRGPLADAPVPVVNVFVGNEQLDARMYSVASGAIREADRDAGRGVAR